MDNTGPPPRHLNIAPFANNSYRWNDPSENINVAFKLFKAGERDMMMNFGIIVCVHLDGLCSAHTHLRQGSNNGAKGYVSVMDNNFLQHAVRGLLYLTQRQSKMPFAGTCCSNVPSNGQKWWAIFFNTITTTAQDGEA